MATPVKVVVNPANTAQKYVLWDNGRIDAKGGAPAITGNPTWYDSPYNLPPPQYNEARSLQITDWAAPGGYVMDWSGVVHAFGNATAPAGSNTAINPFPIAADFDMDPAANGDGYVLSWSGELFVRGGANPLLPLTNPSHFWSLGYPGDRAHRLQIEWPGLKFYIFTRWGWIYSGNGATHVGAFAYWPWWEIAYDFEIYDWATGKGWTLDAWGGVHPINGAQAVAGNPYHPGWSIFRDLAVVDDGTGADPLEFVVVDGLGGMTQWTVSTPPEVAVRNPIPIVTTTTRPLIGWSYTDAEGDAQRSYEVALIEESVYSAASGTDEVQQVAITGTPTGGDFQLAYSGELTAAIAYNANAAAVQAALEALPNVEVGDVICTGGALPGTPVTVTFAARLEKWDLLQMSAVSALTGGTSPAVVITTPTPGTSTLDPATATAIKRWTGSNRSLRGLDMDVDLVNGNYRAFVRATDTAGQSSPWRMTQFEMNVTPLAAPTVTASSGPGYSTQLDVAGVPDALCVLQFHDDDWDGETWEYVRDGVELLLDGLGDGTVIDYEPRFGVERTYRGAVYSVDPRIQSPWSTEETATVTSPARYALTSPADPSLGGLFTIIEPLQLLRPVVGTTLRPSGRANAVVMTDGAPKGREGEITVRTFNRVDFLKLEALLDTGTELYLRDPFGNGWYFAVTGSPRTQLLRTSSSDPAYPTGHLHDYAIGLTQVDRPAAWTDETPIQDYTPAAP